MERKAITNYEGLYEVSDTGSVFALPRYNVDKNGKRKFYPGKELKPDNVVRPQTTYKRVTLSKNGKTKRFSVHRLVAQEFIPNVNDKPHVNHIDNNGSNNNSSNLEWVTHSENMKHAQKQNRLHHSQSKGGSTLGITEDIIKDKIAALLEEGVVNDWTVQSYIGTVKSNTGRDYMFSCKCKCGYEQDIIMTRLYNKIATCCRSCRAMYKTMDTLNTVLAAVKDTQQHDYIYTGNYVMPGTVVRTVKFETKNIIDDTTSYVSFHIANNHYKSINLMI